MILKNKVAPAFSWSTRHKNWQELLLTRQEKRFSFLFFRFYWFFSYFSSYFSLIFLILLINVLFYFHSHRFSFSSCFVFVFLRLFFNLSFFNSFPLTLFLLLYHLPFFLLQSSLTFLSFLSFTFFSFFISKTSYFKIKIQLCPVLFQPPFGIFLIFT